MMRLITYFRSSQIQPRDHLHENFWGTRKATDRAVKMQFGAPASHIRVLGFKSWFCSPFQLPGNGHPGTQQVQDLGPCHPYGRPRLSWRLLSLAWPSPSCCRHLRSEPVLGKSISIYVYLAIHLCLSAFQTNKNTLKLKILRKRATYKITMYSHDKVSFKRSNYLGWTTNYTDCTVTEQGCSPLQFSLGVSDELPGLATISFQAFPHLCNSLI